VVAWRNDRKLCVGVFHEELELVHGVGGVERSCDRPGPGYREEGDHELKVVGEDDRYRPAGLNACCGQNACYTLDLIGQSSVVERRPLRDDDGVVGRSVGGEYLGEGGHVLQFLTGELAL
jgi:hypothetical protein